MKKVVKSAEVKCRNPLTKTGAGKPPKRAYIDDLTVLTLSVQGWRWILCGLDKLILWARMNLKPTKSRSVVLKKGNLEDKFNFNPAGTGVSTLTEKPIKRLGKIVHCRLRDRGNKQSQQHFCSLVFQEWQIRGTQAI